MSLIKSCINYTGGKYRLLTQLLPLFPKNINNFVDLFCGGANVAINLNAKNIFCFDNNKPLIDLFNFIKNNEFDYLLNELNFIIDEYSLSNTYKNGYDFYNTDSGSGLAEYNKKNYLKLRENFNKNIISNYDKCLYFYALIVYGFNNQIRFNKKGSFNIPVGKRDFNSNAIKNLKNFSNTVKEKNIKFCCDDFRNLNLDFINEKDFVYVDPPYLISLASYNEQNAWTEQEEHDLLKLLDKFDDNNVKFALSNVFDNKGKTNLILKGWAQKYNIHYLKYNYNNSNYQIKNKNSKSTEVLICNY
ncbi:MAG: DNA adenine methylase [Methanobacteriaceae archaeon]